MEKIGIDWTILVSIEDHPALKRVCNRTENQPAVDTINGGSAVNLKNLRSLSFIHAMCVVTGVEIEPHKHRCDDNARSDPGSRKEDRSGWIAEN